MEPKNCSALGGTAGVFTGDHSDVAGYDGSGLPGTPPSPMLSLVPHRLYSPHWSPDGRYIAALSGDAQKLMLFDFKNQKWAELARIGVSYPNWSRDGNYVYFHSFGSDIALYRVRISDHQLEKIVSLEGIRLTIGDAGTWSGLAPDDSPLLLRDVGTQEIYALDLQLP